MSIGICNITVAALKSEPNHKSELETQILFGESVKALGEEIGAWIKVETCWDSYQGWVLKNQMCWQNQEVVPEYILSPQGGYVYKNGSKLIMPFGASLPYLNNHNFAFGNNAFSVDGALWQPNTNLLNNKNLNNICTAYMHAPYMWGGRTNFGIDCSGFSAMVYKYFNVPLMAKASWQCTQGQVVDFLQNIVGGELAFFDDENGDITHVGIMLNESEIIHASETTGFIAIDDLDNEGIINRLTGKRTHHLRVVKKIIT